MRRERKGVAFSNPGIFRIKKVQYSGWNCKEGKPKLYILLKIYTVHIMCFGKMGMTYFIRDRSQMSDALETHYEK